MGNGIKRARYLLIFLAALIMLGGCNNKQASQDNKGNNNITKSINSETSKNKTDSINSGLLIGFTKSNNINKSSSPLEAVPDSLRTLWIHIDGNKVVYSEKKNSIITPYGESFEKLTIDKLIISESNEYTSGTSDTIFGKYSSYYNFSSVVSQEANKGETNILTKDAVKKNYINKAEGEMGIGYGSRTESLLYVGNKYVCIKTSKYNTGGGTFRVGSDDIKMFDVKDLSSLEGHNINTKLSNLVGNTIESKLDSYRKKYNKTVENGSLIKEDYLIDSNNLALNRSEGKWRLQVPLYDKYYHEGNGSSYYSVKEIYDTDISLPTNIISYDTLCVDWNTIKSKIPDARDAVSSPNKDMLAVLTANKLMIFVYPEKGITQPIGTIPVDENEKIILNQWATGDYVEKWNKALSNY
ncbi:MAG: hypothetical protein Q8936_07015 [Bacillota bacterium]|nr:hypothetical protein [Bacillota bacterium]